MASMIHVILITIGDELLIGQVIDTNSAWMAQKLNELGIGVLERRAVADKLDDIKRAVDEALKRSDVVLITGGLGPTKDDLTKDALTDYFNTNLVVDADVRSDVEEFFSRSKRPMLAANLKQAEVPALAKALRNKKGTAPGMWFDVNGKTVVSLPGVPYEMKAMMEEYVLPELKQRFQGGAIVHQTVMTCGIGESFLAEKIKDWENALPPHVKLAYLPHLNVVRLRLTALGENERALKRELETLTQSLLPLIDDFVFGLGDISLEDVVGVMLQERNAFLSTAESCTGGYIAHKLTAVQGASEWFKGALVTYATESKSDVLGVSPRIIEKYGVVSEPVVKRMAKRVAKKFDTQYAVSISGWADPKTTQDGDPAGLIWIGWYDGKNATAKSFQFFRERMQNIEMATTMALDGLRKIMLKNETPHSPRQR